MSQPQDNLAKALAQNGSFDPQRATELKQKAVAALNAKMRRVERVFWVVFLFCVWVLCSAFTALLGSSSTRDLIFCAVLILVMYESTVLMKLWYWTMNNKISVLKEIKQLRLETFLAAPAEAPMWGRGFEEPARSLPRWERVAWWIALIAILLWELPVYVGSVSIGPDLLARPPQKQTLTSEGCVTLASDGSGSVVTRMSFVHQGFSPTRSITFPAPRSAVVSFLDTRGAEMPFTTTPQNGELRYDVTLPHPVDSGSRFSYTRVLESPECATRDGDVWTCSNNYRYGYATSEFAETVVLPEGAQIVSAEPWPVAAFTLNNKPTLRFETTRGRSEPFKYTVRYRLPADPSK